MLSDLKEVNQEEVLEVEEEASKTQDLMNRPLNMNINQEEFKEQEVLEVEKRKVILEVEEVEEVEEVLEV